MKTETAQNDAGDPRETLRYHPSKVEWATAKFVQKPPAFIARSFFYLLMLSIASGVVYAWFAKVAVTVEAPGALQPEQGVLPINSPITMTVRELRASENQKVTKGDLLVVSAGHLSKDEEQRIAEDAEKLRGLLAKDKKLNCKSCLAEYERLAGKAFHIAEGGRLRDRLTLLRQRLREYATLRSGFANRGSSTMSLRRQISTAQKKLAQIRARGAETLLATKVEQLQSEIVAARSQIADRDAGGRSGVANARNQLMIQLADLDDDVALYEKSQSIHAPISGTVTELAIKGAGQRLSAGQKVMEIVPADSKLAAELRVADRDISRVREGMEVRLKLAALPEREYGVATGRIESVAPNVSFDVKGAAGKPVYRVIVALDQQALSKDGKDYEFRLGMTLRGLIVSAYEPMLTLALKRLLNIKDDLFAGS